MLDSSKQASKSAAVIAVSCLSGGSGKTTTALNLAIMLSDLGKTLVIDFDPQGNLSQWLGYPDLSNEPTIAETILPDSDRLSIKEIIKPPKTEDRKGRLFLAPGDYSLSHAAEMIAPAPGRERFLLRALKPVLEDYEFIVIDTPPAKGILTYNGILAADFLVIPTECTDKGVRGAVSTMVLLKELEDIDFAVPRVLGIVPTRDQWSGANQTRMSKAALAALKENLPHIHIFNSVRQSTVVQRANHAGWSLVEASEKKLAKPYTEVVDTIRKVISHV